MNRFNIPTAVRSILRAAKRKGYFCRVAKSVTTSTRYVHAALDSVTIVVRISDHAPTRARLRTGEILEIYPGSDMTVKQVVGKLKEGRRRAKEQTSCQ